MGTLRGHLLSPLSQIAMSVGVVLVGYVVMWIFNDGIIDTPFVEAADLQDFLFGLGTMLSLIGPIMYGFSAQEIHACVAEKSDILDKYHSRVDRLLDQLSRLVSDGRLDGEGYLQILRHVYALNEGDIDNFYPKGVWEEAARGLREWFSAAYVPADEHDEADRYFMEAVTPLLLRIEFAINAINVNVIRRVIAVGLSNRSVGGAFACIAILLFVLAASAFEHQQMANVYFLLTMLVLVFSVFLVVQLVLTTRQNAREALSDELEEPVDG